MRTVWILFFGLILVFSAEAQEDANPRYQEYLDTIRDLQTRWQEIGSKEGREGLIRRYHILIDSNPGFEKNIEMEARIAEIYTWELPNDPSTPEDAVRRFEAYQSIIERYPPEDPFMKQVKVRAGEASADIFPDKSAEIFRNLIDEYPDDDILRLNCYLQLGLNAFRKGNKKEAEQFYSLVLMYDPGGLVAPHSAEAQDVTRFRTNAALDLFWLAFEEDAPPLLQRSLLVTQLKKYPQIEWWHSDIVIEEFEKLDKAIREEMDVVEKGVVDSLELVPVDVAPGAGDALHEDGADSEAVRIDEATVHRQTTAGQTGGSLGVAEGAGGRKVWWLVLAAAGFFLVVGIGAGMARRG